MPTSFDDVSAEDVVVPQADSEEYVVYLDPNGGDGDVIGVGDATSLMPVDTPKPTREGYTFMGWADNPNNPTVVLYNGLHIPGECFGKKFYALWAKGSGTFEEPIYGEVKASFAAIPDKYFASGTEIWIYYADLNPGTTIEVNGSLIPDSNDGEKLTLVLTEGSYDILLSGLPGINAGTETDVEDHIEFSNRSAYFQCFAVDYTPPYETLEFLSDPGDGDIQYIG